MRKLTILLFVMMIALTGCGMDKQSSNTDKENNKFETISTEEAKKMMKNENNYLILDVRTKEEYKEGHIPNAINIPNEIISADTVSELKDKEQLIFVYCRSGARSRQASEKLVKLGYTKIRDFGGIGNWDGEIVRD